MRKLHMACAIFSALVFSTCAMADIRAAAVVDDGYAGGALQKIMGKYSGQPAPGQRQEAKLFLDADGALLDCRALKGDVKALCHAARAAAPFGEPPYGVPTSIVVAIWGAKDEAKAKPAAAQAAPAKNAGASSKYLEKVRRELRNAMYIPEKTRPGVYQVTARVKCDAAGKILDSSIIRSSGDSLLDKYVIQGIHRAGAITPPPEGSGDSLDITFTLKR